MSSNKKRSGPGLSVRQYGLTILICIQLISSINHLKAGNKADSLATELENSTEDSIRIRLLNSLGGELRRTQPEKAEQYLTRALQLAHQTGQKDQEATTLDNYGNYFISNGKYIQAIKKYGEAGEQYQALGKLKEVANTLHRAGDCWFFLGNIDSCEAYIRKALRIREKINDRQGESDAWRRLGNIQDVRGKIEEAKAAYQKAIAILTKLGDQDFRISKCYNNLGTLYARRGEFKMAIKNMAIADSLMEGTPDKGVRAILINNMGNVYQDQGNAPKALEYYLKALELARETKDERAINTFMFNLGVFHDRLGNREEAFRYMNQTLEIAKKKGAKREVARATRAMGQFQRKEGKMKEAQQNLRKALAIVLEIGDKKETIEISRSIGITFMTQEQYDSAETWYLKSLALSKEIQNENQSALVNLQLGILYQKQGKLDEALQAALESFAWTQKNDYLDLAHTAAGLLANLYAERRAYPKALYYDRIHKALGDTILNEDNIKAITRLEFQYQEEERKQAEQLKREQEAAIHEAEIKREKSLRDLFIAAIGIMILLAGLFYWNYRIKRKANKTLVMSNHLINQQKERINWLNQNLEKEVVNRTRELETRNKQLQSYAFLNAHEVRGPLARILGLLEVNRIGALKTEKEKTEMIHHIKRSAEEIERVILDINDQLSEKKRSTP